MFPKEDSYIFHHWTTHINSSLFKPSLRSFLSRPSSSGRCKMLCHPNQIHDQLPRRTVSCLLRTCQFPANLWPNLPEHNQRSRRELLQWPTETCRGLPKWTALCLLFTFINDTRVSLSLKTKEIQNIWKLNIIIIIIFSKTCNRRKFEFPRMKIYEFSEK
jgi:hypothetical protein